MHNQLKDFKQFTHAEELASFVGEVWKELQNAVIPNNRFTLSSPLSSTPLQLYTWVINHAESFTHWDAVDFVLMDEMLEREYPPTYVSRADKASYEGFARKYLLDPLKEKTTIDIPVIKPELDSITTFQTPIDLLILALGVNGNYANVMPGTPLTTGWHIAHLIAEFRQAHTQKESQSFAGATFREYGMSLGPQQTFSAKHIIVMITGEKKQELTKQLLSYSDFDPNFPLSIIYHPEVTPKTRLYVTKDTLT